jgi:hypothetical protein
MLLSDMLMFCKISVENLVVFFRGDCPYALLRCWWRFETYEMREKGNEKLLLTLSQRDFMLHIHRQDFKVANCVAPKDLTIAT